MSERIVIERTANGLRISTPTDVGMGTFTHDEWQSVTVSVEDGKTYLTMTPYDLAYK